MRIYKTTVSELLWKTLVKLMNFEELKSFRLVGGTSLSLMLGHRISVDIDLFTDQEYNSINFEIIDNLFINSFKYVHMGYGGNNSMGKSYYVGNNADNVIKIDLFYTDKFVFPAVKHKGIRMSQLKEIAAMKLEVVGNNGRKKDFWDLHELMEKFTWKEMLEFYHKKYPFGYSSEEIFTKLTDFKEADYDLDPICLKNKYWELIKLDIEESVNKNLL